MRNLILLLSILAFSLNCYSQEKPKTDTTKKTEIPKVVNPIKDDTYGWKDRFAFIVGGGVSTTSEKLYDIPVVSKNDNIVRLEQSQKLRTSLTLGLVYTPSVSNSPRYITKPKDSIGTKLDTITIVEYYPRGLSYALFINPISLTKLNDGTFTNNVDLGIGIGWRSGDWLFLATADFFSVKQPRKYFIDQYQNNDKQYIINGQVQNSIDVNDNSIFSNKIVSSFGIKMCYTFNLTKTFYSNSQQLTK